MSDFETRKVKTLLVLGGTSDIGRACAAAFAAVGRQVQLAGRDPAALEREAGDISTRTGAAVSTHYFDVLDTGSFITFVAGLPVMPDTVLCVIGLLGDQTRAETDIALAASVMRSNYEGPSLILGLFADRFVARGSGTIIGLSSVAGDRGRASNYVYGSAKAGFTAFLSGLRNRLSRHGVHVLTVKPGFVRTRMTADLTLPLMLTASPEVVARQILAASGRGADIIYTYRRWAVVMSIICAIPERIFKRLSL